MLLEDYFDFLGDEVICHAEWNAVKRSIWEILHFVQNDTLERNLGSDEISTRLSTFLNNWVMLRRLGRVTGSSAGFILPSIEKNGSNNGEEQPRNLRAPDVSFVCLYIKIV